MGTREIRTAEPADATAIRDVARESWHAAYDDLLGAETVDNVVDDWYAVDGLRSAIRRAAHHFFVADDGEVGGFVHVGPWDDEPSVAHLIRLYVRPAAWGEGTGSALLERAEAALAGEGYDRLRLEAFAENEVGVWFYESRGFERVEGVTEEILGETYDVSIYERAVLDETARIRS